MESHLTEKLIPTEEEILYLQMVIKLSSLKKSYFFEARMNQMNTNLVTSKHFSNELIADSGRVNRPKFHSTATEVTISLF